MGRRFLCLVVTCAVLTASDLAAQDRSYLGHGHLLTNDLIGDGEDRWRTGSYQSSRFWGPAPNGALAERFGQMLELRVGGEIVAPADLGRIVPGDRRFAGVLTFGLHTHFAAAGLENSAGVELAFTGPQTGLDDFQSFLHDTLGASDLSSGVRAIQIDDGVHPGLVLESARAFDLARGAQIRPYVEGRLGLENLVRIGADLRFGQIGAAPLMARDTVTGHRYGVGAAGDATGVGFVLGADIAYVGDSALLPESAGYDLTETRGRVRSGVAWQTKKGIGGFYGLTWLSEEFEGQGESQIVGSLRLHFNF